MNGIKINEKFNNCLCGLSTKEYSGLEKDIIQNGCKDPIVIWNSYIIDGHHRYDICEKNNIEFTTIDWTEKFTDEGEVEDWIQKHQDSRRNNNLFKKVSTTLTPHLNRVSTSLTPNPELSARELAEKAGCSRQTANNVKRILENNDKDIIEKLENNDISIYEAMKLIPKKPRQSNSVSSKKDSKPDIPVSTDVSQTPNDQFENGTMTETITKEEFVTVDNPSLDQKCTVDTKAIEKLQRKFKDLERRLSGAYEEIDCLKEDYGDMAKEVDTLKSQVRETRNELREEKEKTRELERKVSDLQTKLEKGGCEPTPQDDDSSQSDLEYRYSLFKGRADSDESWYDPSRSYMEQFAEMLEMEKEHDPEEYKKREEEWDRFDQESKDRAKKLESLRKEKQERLKRKEEELEYYKNLPENKGKSVVRNPDTDRIMIDDFEVRDPKEKEIVLEDWWQIKNPLKIIQNIFTGEEVGYYGKDKEEVFYDEETEEQKKWRDQYNKEIEEQKKKGLVYPKRKLCKVQRQKLNNMRKF